MRGVMWYLNTIEKDLQVFESRRIKMSEVDLTMVRERMNQKKEEKKLRFKKE